MMRRRASDKPYENGGGSGAASAGSKPSGARSSSSARERRASRKMSESTSFGMKFVGSFVVVVLVVYFRQHYIKSRKIDPFLGGTASSTAGISTTTLHTADDKQQQPAKTQQERKPLSERHSLLSIEEDAALEFDRHNDNVRYHVIFSTDCSSYQHWQSYLVYYTAMKIKQPGHVTRIASGCDDEAAAAMQEWFDTDVQYMSQRFHLQLTPHFSNIKNADGQTVGDYKFFNKPFGLKYWLEHAPQIGFTGGNDATSETDTDATKKNLFPPAVENDVVILIDPDMAILRPLTNNFASERETVIGPRRRAADKMLATHVGPGQPFAQVYGFGAQWSRLDLAKITGDENSPALAVTHEDAVLYFPVGPPYLGTVNDMYAIATKWTEFVPAVYEQYPHLLAEMFAYCIAAAHLNLKHQLIDSLMISKDDASGEGWSLVENIPVTKVCEFAADIDHAEYAVPSVVHYCQRYALGDRWFFSKRKIPSDIYDCETPLLEEPPGDAATTLNWKQPPGSKQKTDLSEVMVKRNAFMLCYLKHVVNDAASFYKQNTCVGKPNLSKTRNLIDYLNSLKKK